MYRQTKVEEVRRKVLDKKLGETGEKSIYGTLEEMQERAKEGYYMRNLERNLDCLARETDLKR